LALARDDEYLTTAETAALLKTTSNALLCMRYRGTAPPAYEVHRRLLWKRSEVVARIESSVSESSRPRKQPRGRNASRTVGKTTGARKTVRRTRS
jgi:hypothetical protein